MSLWKQSEKLNNSIPEGTRILFQGDSISYGGRNRDVGTPNDVRGVGTGYVSDVAKQILVNHPKGNIQCYNRGVGGDTVFRMALRWQSECLDLRPDVLSILIGVNDAWGPMANSDNGAVHRYKNGYDTLLKRTKDALPEIKLIIAEPFIFKEGSALQGKQWLSLFEAYRNASWDLASKYNAQFIPLQSIFDVALVEADSMYWSPDGIHPSMLGSYLMAQAWLDTIGRLY